MKARKKQVIVGENLAEMEIEVKSLAETDLLITEGYQLFMKAGNNYFNELNKAVDKLRMTMYSNYKSANREQKDEWNDATEDER